MVHTKESSDKKDESAAPPGWMLAMLYAPLLVAAATVLSLLVTMHVMYAPWLIDTRYRQYSLYIACAATVYAFLMCCCIVFTIRRKQIYGRSSFVTVRTRLLDSKSYLPLYVDVETPPAEDSVLPLKCMAPPVDATKTSAG